jgi:hypothetical protein
VKWIAHLGNCEGPAPGPGLQIGDGPAVLAFCGENQVGPGHLVRLKRLRRVVRGIHPPAGERDHGAGVDRTARRHLHPCTVHVERGPDPR